MGPVQVGSITLGDGGLVLIAGPCVIESEEGSLRIAEGLVRICQDLGLPLVFKSSFDKANRTAADAFRGPGLEAGLRLLERVGRELGVALCTDVHLPGQAAPVAEVVDLLQVPAFLCRQTDLLVACGQTGKPVNIKKGQFMAPEAMAGALAKVGGPALITERGACFGHGDLVVDFRGLPLLRELGAPVVFDATHAVQRPGASHTGGDRAAVPALARAAAAVGIDALFLEVHDDPSLARSDAAVQWPLDALPGLLREVLAVHAAVAP